MSEDKPLISVVISTFNRTEALKRAINSVIKQTYSNLEIIVVDDNKDAAIRKETLHIAESFNDRRIHLVLNPSNLGGALSRNEGIKRARGEFVAFLDDDDEFLPTKLEKQYEFWMRSHNPKLGLLYNYVISDDKKKTKYRYNFKGCCVYDAMIDCIAATSQWFCKKGVLTAIGMFHNVPCKQDSNLMIRLLTAGYEVDVVPEILSIYHCDQAERISGGAHQKRIDGETAFREICRSHYDLLSGRKQAEMVEYSFALRLAEHYRALGDRENYENCCKIIRKHPFRMRTLKFYAKLVRGV